jgi:hypothetical protein
MKLAKYSYAILIIVFSMARWEGSLGGDNVPDPGLIGRKLYVKGGARLTEAESAAIARMSTVELADLLKNGETLHAQAALQRLLADLKRNFDLLLSIAAERRGDMIVEHLSWPVQASSSTEEGNAMLDRFLDFLEGQLSKSKPSVTGAEAIRSIALTVYLGPRMHAVGPKPPDPNDLVVPYGNARVLGILRRCLDNEDWRVRSEAAQWLGSVGVNDPNMAENVVFWLEAQSIKEQAGPEDEKVKAHLVASVQKSLALLNGELRGLRWGYNYDKSLQASPEWHLAGLRAEKEGPKRTASQLYLLRYVNLWGYPRPEIRREVGHHLVEVLLDPNLAVAEQYYEALSLFVATDFEEDTKVMIRSAVAETSPRITATQFAGLVRICGIANIREELPRLKDLLIDESIYKKKTTQANQTPPADPWYKTVGWSARLARARMGVAEDIERCIEAVEAEENLGTCAFALLHDIGYIRQPEAIEYLGTYLKSDEIVRSSEAERRLAYAAMYVLDESLSNFPVRKKGPYTFYVVDEVGLCRKWMAEQREWKIRR